MAISPQNNENTVFYTGKLYGLTGMTVCNKGADNYSHKSTEQNNCANDKQMKSQTNHN